MKIIYKFTKNLFLYILFVLYILIVIILNKNKYNTCNITLVIPTIRSTYIYCQSRIIEMINSSYLKPNEVIIVISENKKALIIEKRLCGILFIFFYKTGKHNQAENRNTGIGIAKCKYITFFDSDDYMSKSRIKILYKTFIKYSYIDIILHSFTNNFKHLYEYDNDEIDVNNISYNYTPKDIYFSYYNNRNVSINNKWCCIFLNKNLNIHNAWLSGKTNILKRHKYNESWIYYRVEDTELNNRLILNKFNVVLLKINLGVYIPHSKC